MKDPQPHLSGRTLRHEISIYLSHDPKPSPSHNLKDQSHQLPPTDQKSQGSKLLPSNTIAKLLVDPPSNPQSKSRLGEAAILANYLYTLRKLHRLIQRTLGTHQSRHANLRPKARPLQQKQSIPRPQSLASPAPFIFLKYKSDRGGRLL